jgi:hypothetical protein
MSRPKSATRHRLRSLSIFASRDLNHHALSTPSKLTAFLISLLTESTVLELTVRALQIRPVGFFLTIVLGSFIAHDDKTKRNNKKFHHAIPSRHHAQSVAPIRSLGYCHRPKATANLPQGALCSFRPPATIFKILIANPRLKFRLTGCKTNHVQFSNRERFSSNRHWRRFKFVVRY